MSTTTINTHYGKNIKWTVYRNGYNAFVGTLTLDGSAYDISSRVFTAYIRTPQGSENKLTLTEGDGITNGGATGLLTIALTEAQLATLPRDRYFIVVEYTIDSKDYPLCQGYIETSSETNPGTTTTSATIPVSINGETVSMAVTLAGGGGGGTWGSITGTLSGQTDLQTALDAKVDEETFATLTDGSTVTWNTNSRQNPLAKLTSTQSFTIDMTNVKSGACGILKLVKNTASDVTMTFDTSFTNKTQNTSLTTYTFSGSSGNEYFLSFVVEGTAIEWVIGDVAAYTNTETFALVRRTASQSVANNTLTAISFDTETYDNASIYDSGAPTRLTIPGSGSKLAILSASASFASDADGIRRINIHVNGSSVALSLGAWTTLPSNSSTSADIHLTTQIPCSGGDYIEVMVQHVAGAALNVTGVAAISIRNL